MKSGVSLSESVKTKFFSAGSEGIRFIKVQLNDDWTNLVETATGNASGDWESDFSLVPEHLEDKTPCFILYRTDSEIDGRSSWYMCSYVPDTAPVRQKMVYASTLHSFKNDLGSHHFVGDIAGTNRSDFSAEGFQEYLRHSASEAPLTAEEQLKREERQAGLAECGGGSSVAYAHGVSFPIDDGVHHAFDEMKRGSINYIQLAIDLEAEIIKVGTSGSYSTEEVANQVPLGDCAYHYFNWVHDHEGNEVASLVFAFSCPDGSGGTKGAPVKQRMLYASSKATAIGIPALEGMEVACKLEVASPADFGESEYSVVIHPPQAEEKKGFKKPSAPRGRKLVGK